SAVRSRNYGEHRGRTFPTGVGAPAMLEGPVQDAREGTTPPVDLAHPQVSSIARDDAGAVVRAWRGSTGSSQAETARLLNMTQQNLSQIENGRQTMSYEQRQRAVSVLGISAEELGLSLGRPLTELDSAVAVNQARWRQERRWLNQHRSE